MRISHPHAYTQGRLRVPSNGSLEGTITYNGDRADSGRFNLGVVATYVDQSDVNEPLLSVRETLVSVCACVCVRVCVMDRARLGRPGFIHYFFQRKSKTGVRRLVRGAQGDGGDAQDAVLRGGFVGLGKHVWIRFCVDEPSHH